MKKVLIIIIAIIIAFIINFFLVEKIVISDPCLYHNNPTEKMSEILRLFYKITPSEGYHPFPTTFNFVTTLLIGIFGALIGFKFIKKQ